MTDEPAPVVPPAQDPAASERARVESPRARRFDALPVLYLLGFVVLSGALVYLYRHPAIRVLPAQEAGLVDTLQQQVETLGGRIGRLESRPAPAAAAPAADLAPLEARIAELEKRPAGSAGAPVDLAPLTARLAEVERRPAPPPPVPPPPPVDLGPLTARLGALEAQGRSAVEALTRRLDALEPRIATAEAQAKQTAGALAAIADRSQRVSRLQAAAAALEAGQKLGDIPGAPPALARFAQEAPPTDAALRLSFGRAAEAAQRASQPAIMEDQPFATRLWNRAQQVVTVRQGDRVLLGDPVAGVLAHAREALDAGDLRGAVAALDGLAGPAAAAMSGWTSQARALIEARAALSGMAAG